MQSLSPAFTARAAQHGADDSFVAENYVELKRHFRKTYLLVFLLLAVLAACNQAPAPEATEPDAPPELGTLKFGSSGFEAATGLAGHSTGVYVVGYTTGNLHGTSKGSTDAFIRKYDATGAVLWGTQFGTAADDIATGVASDSNNNAYVVGYTTGSVYDASADSNGNLYFAGETYISFAGSNRGNTDGYIIKLNPDGLYVWRKVIGTAQSDGTIAVLARG